MAIEKVVMGKHLEYYSRIWFVTDLRTEFPFALFYLPDLTERLGLMAELFYISFSHVFFFDSFSEISPSCLKKLPLYQEK